uniref:Condensation domain-containing protein n=1 Tax=Globisporangium ultimum (strain ATCC 200006 / CBS 805.95 / DAOM BR144) TaxID=431595 RepID=K3W5S8_GLOUD
MILIRATSYMEQDEPQRQLQFEYVNTMTTTVDDVLASANASLVPHREPHKLLVVRCTFLSDGGLVIALNINHCVFGADAYFTFMTQCGLHYRDVSKVDRPVISHDRHLLFCSSGKGPRFEHREYTIVDVSPMLQPSSFNNVSVPVIPKTTSHIFHLSKANLNALKTFAAGGVASICSRQADAYISTMDAATALMVLLITQARGHHKNLNVGVAVNGRRRFDPPLPENYAGNVVFTAFSSYEASELDTTISSSPSSVCDPHMLAVIALRLRQSILRQNDEYMRDTLAFLAVQESPRCVQVSTKFAFGSDVMASSWVDLGAMDATLGPGHCTWRRPTSPFATDSSCSKSCRSAPSMKTEEEKGIDALVYLEAEAMARLKRLWMRVLCCLHEQQSELHAPYICIS